MLVTFHISVTKYLAGEKTHTKKKHINETRFVLVDTFRGSGPWLFGSCLRASIAAIKQQDSKHIEEEGVYLAYSSSL